MRSPSGQVSVFSSTLLGLGLGLGLGLVLGLAGERVLIHLHDGIP